MTDFSLKLIGEQYEELAQFWHEYMLLGPSRKQAGLDRAGVALDFCQWMDIDPDEDPVYSLPEALAFLAEKERREGTALAQQADYILGQEDIEQRRHGYGGVE